jgi:hypothetical protein
MTQEGWELVRTNYVGTPPSIAPPDPAVWRAWVVEQFGPNWYWDVCASCGEPIRPPEQFYEQAVIRVLGRVERRGQVAHVRQCWKTDDHDTRREPA